MTTFLELKNLIEDDMDRNDISTQISNAINRSISYYSSEIFYFQETSSTFNVSSGTYIYTTATIPSDIREINNIQITIGSYDYEVKPRSIDYIINTDPSNYNGDPTDYAFYNQSIYFSPTPNATRTITIYYDKSYADLSATSDTNDFTTIPIATDMIRARAEWILYKQLLGDNESAALSKELEIDSYYQLKKQTENFQAGVKNTTFTG
jgi:hypothetical protein